MSSDPTQESSMSNATESSQSQTKRAQIDAAWGELFPYPEVYSEQVTGINSLIETVGQEGYYVLEGACGTGKTALAVVGCLSLVEHSDQIEKERGMRVSSFNRVFVSTPVKQQLAQFVQEMRAINEHSPYQDPVSTAVIRGKSDLIAYAQVPELLEHGSQESEDQAQLLPEEDQGSSTSSPEEAAQQTKGDTEKHNPDDLRQVARRLIKFDSQIPLDWPDGWTPPDYSQVDYNWETASDEAKRIRESNRFDPHRAQVVKELVAGSGEEKEEPTNLEIEGHTTPYPETLPSVQQVADSERLTGDLAAVQTGLFDPFYVGFFAGGAGPGYDFGETHSYVYDRESLIKHSVTRGVCPYESMKHFAEQAQVVVGNYTHVFDPQTRRLTKGRLGLLDEETLLIVDEAHEIEERVRGMLSDSVRYQTLEKAKTDVDLMKCLLERRTEPLMSELQFSEEDVETACEIAQAGVQTETHTSVSPAELDALGELIQLLKLRLREFTKAELEDTYDWIPQTQDEVGDWRPQEGEIPLSAQATETEQDTDKLLEAITDAGYEPELLQRAERVFQVIQTGYKTLEENGYESRSVQTVVGRLLTRWVCEDTITYHRTIRLRTESRSQIPAEAPPWMRKLVPKYELFNCIPRSELQEIFGELGGGVLMSATIEPADIFTHAVGITDVEYAPGTTQDRLSELTADSSTPAQLRAHNILNDPDQETRPVTYQRYPLRFSERNRLSVIGLLDKYTSSNRGPIPTDSDDEMTDVRSTYAETLVEIAQQPGNVLIALPNYQEAEWMHRVLQQREVNKRIHLDQSSSSQETTETLQAFFREGNAVILTSTRGTITTGVDYDGHKLHSAVVAGIPLVPVQIPRNQAIREAYGAVMPIESGFEAAFTVPAVRKARQAIGRVIRGPNEVGTRLLIDERYNSTDWDGVSRFLSPQERDEFQPLIGTGIGRVLNAFWDDVSDTCESP